MKFDALRYFVAVAREQHVGRAAKQLAVSPSAVSHVIKALEEQYGLALFVREGKAIRITDHGIVLKERFQQILDDLAGIPQHLHGGEGALHGHVRCAGSHVIASTLLARAATDLKSRHPDLSFELSSHRSGAVRDLVTQGLAEFGICFSPLPHPGLEISRLHKGKLLVAVRSGHPVLRVKADQQLIALSTFPTVLPSSAPGIERCDQHPMFLKYRIKTATLAFCDSYETMAQIVVRSNSWGLFPEIMLKILSCRLKPIHLPKEWDAPYDLACLWLPALRSGAFAIQMQGAIAQAMATLASRGR